MAKNDTTSTEAVEVESTEIPVEEVIDLSGFTGAVETAVENADDATGDVPEADIAAVRTAYQDLSVKGKNQAKAHLQDVMKQYLVELDASKARSIMILTQEAAVAGKSTSSTPKPAADPAEVYGNQLTQLTLALFLAQRAVPEGVDGSTVSQAASDRASELFESAVTVFESEDQETNDPTIRAAIKLATTKVRKGRASSGERRDLGAHIEAAFAGVKKGDFLSVAQIRSFESAEYGNDKPSAGAISNRLQPKSGKATTIPGITVETRDGKLGAVKN